MHGLRRRFHTFTPVPTIWPWYQYNDESKFYLQKSLLTCKRRHCYLTFFIRFGLKCCNGTDYIVASVTGLHEAVCLDILRASIAVLCVNFLNKWATENEVVDEHNIERLEFNRSFRGISNPRWSRDVMITSLLRQSDGNNEINVTSYVRWDIASAPLAMQLRASFTWEYIWVVLLRDWHF